MDRSRRDRIVVFGVVPVDNGQCFVHRQVVLQAVDPADVGTGAERDQDVSPIANVLQPIDLGLARNTSFDERDVVVLGLPGGHLAKLDNVDCVQQIHQILAFDVERVQLATLAASEIEECDLWLHHTASRRFLSSASENTGPSWHA